MAIYTVKKGETLGSIAKRHSMSWKSLYEHPRNIGLRSKRPNPNRIFPGDEMWVPDEDPAPDQAQGTEKPCDDSVPVCTWLNEVEEQELPAVKKHDGWHTPQRIFDHLIPEHIVLRNPNGKTRTVYSPHPEGGQPVPLFTFHFQVAPRIVDFYSATDYKVSLDNTREIIDGYLYIFKEKTLVAKWYFPDKKDSKELKAKTLESGFKISPDSFVPLPLEPDGRCSELGFFYSPIPLTQDCLDLLVTDKDFKNEVFVCTPSKNYQLIPVFDCIAWIKNLYLELLLPALEAKELQMSSDEIYKEGIAQTLVDLLNYDNDYFGIENDLSKKNSPKKFLEVREEARLQNDEVLEKTSIRIIRVFESLTFRLIEMSALENQEQDLDLLVETYCTTIPKLRQTKAGEIFSLFLVRNRCIEPSLENERLPAKLLYRHLTLTSDGFKIVENPTREKNENLFTANRWTSYALLGLACDLMPVYAQYLEGVSKEAKHFRSKKRQELLLAVLTPLTKKNKSKDLFSLAYKQALSRLKKGKEIYKAPQSQSKVPSRAAKNIAKIELANSIIAELDEFVKNDNEYVKIDEKVDRKLKTQNYAISKKWGEAFDGVQRKALSAVTSPLEIINIAVSIGTLARAKSDKDITMATEKLIGSIGDAVYAVDQFTDTIKTVSKGGSTKASTKILFKILVVGGIVGAAVDASSFARTYLEGMERVDYGKIVGGSVGFLGAFSSGAATVPPILISLGIMKSGAAALAFASIAGIIGIALVAIGYLIYYAFSKTSYEDFVRVCFFGKDRIKPDLKQLSIPWVKGLLPFRRLDEEYFQFMAVKCQYHISAANHKPKGRGLDLVIDFLCFPYGATLKFKLKIERGLESISNFGTYWDKSKSSTGWFDVFVELPSFPSEFAEKSDSKLSSAYSIQNITKRTYDVPEPAIIATARGRSVTLNLSFRQYAYVNAWCYLEIAPELAGELKVKLPCELESDTGNLIQQYLHIDPSKEQGPVHAHNTERWHHA